MSVDEDNVNELRELVSKTLETTGVLAKIRAELRASVFLALEEQDAFKDKQTLLNKTLKDFVSTTEGAVVICLVKEFLEFFGLEFTMAVFDPETQLGQDYEYQGRNKLAKELKIKTVKKTPLLAQVLQTAYTSLKIEEQDDSSSQSESVSKVDGTKNNEDKPSVIKVLNHGSLLHIENKNMVNGSIRQETTKEPNSPKQEDGPNSPKQISQTQQNFVPQLNIGIRKPDSLKLDSNQANSKTTNSSLSSLAHLPPLSSNRQIGRAAISNELKTIMDQGTNDIQDNYDEDFHSTASEKTRKGGQVSASGSEIDEEISSVGDDQTSISGAGDEGTVDTSISQESGQGDYEEKV